MGDGSRVAGGGKARSSLRPPPSTHHPSPEEIARLVEAHEGLVWWVAAKFWHRELYRRRIGHTLAAIADAGRPGLFYAARKWQAERGKFTTYAKFWIRFAIQEECRLAAIVLPGYVWKKEPDRFKLRTLDDFRGPNWRVRRGIPDPTAGPDAEAEASDSLRRLEALLSGRILSDRQRLALRLRYGLEGEGEHSFDQIGARLGLSGERARQIVAGAVASLREAF